MHGSDIRTVEVMQKKLILNTICKEDKSKEMALELDKTDLQDKIFRIARQSGKKARHYVV